MSLLEDFLRQAKTPPADSVVPDDAARVRNRVASIAQEARAVAPTNAAAEVAEVRADAAKWNAVRNAPPADMTAVRERFNPGITEREARGAKLRAMPDTSEAARARWNATAGPRIPEGHVPLSGSRAVVAPATPPAAAPAAAAKPFSIASEGFADVAQRASLPDAKLAVGQAAPPRLPAPTMPGAAGFADVPTARAPVAVNGQGVAMADGAQAARNPGMIARMRAALGLGGLPGAAAPGTVAPQAAIQAPPKAATIADAAAQAAPKAAASAAPTAAAPTAAAPTAAGQAAAPAVDAATANSRAYKVGKMLGKAAPALKIAGGAALGADVMSHFNDYKLNDPGVDSSAEGTYRALTRGDLAGVGKSLGKGAIETLMDLGSFAAHTADVFVPDTPVSEAYDGWLREKFGQQLVAHPSTQPAKPAAAVTAGKEAPAAAAPAATGAAPAAAAAMPAAMPASAPPTIAQAAQEAAPVDLDPRRIVNTTGEWGGVNNVTRYHTADGRTIEVRGAGDRQYDPAAQLAPDDAALIDAYQRTQRGAPAAPAAPAPAPGTMTADAGSKQAANGAPDMRRLVADSATALGYDPTMAMMKVSMESGFDPKAKNPTSSAFGVGQLLKANRAQYGSEEQWKDPAFQAQATIDFMKRSDADLAQRIRREPSPGERYMGHLFGPAGAAAVLAADPNLPIEKVVASYDPKNAKAIVKHNRMEGMTAGQAVAMWNQKAQATLAQLGQGTAAPAAAPVAAPASIAQAATAWPNDGSVEIINPGNRRHMEVPTATGYVSMEPALYQASKIALAAQPALADQAVMSGQGIVINGTVVPPLVVQQGESAVRRYLTEATKGALAAVNPSEAELEKARIQAAGPASNNYIKLQGGRDPETFVERPDRLVDAKTGRPVALGDGAPAPAAAAAAPAAATAPAKAPDPAVARAKMIQNVKAGKLTPEQANALMKKNGHAPLSAAELG